MMKWLSAPLALLAFFLIAALFTQEAEGITLDGYFSDDNGHLFENDIDSIAAAGITKGCNPPANTRFCPNDNVTRGEMAAFLRRALELPSSGIQTIPVGHHDAMICSKDGERCSLTVDLSASRQYRVQEGIFQVMPANTQEMNAFNAANTRFGLTLDGASLSIDELARESGGGVVERRWRRSVQFSPGTHTLIGRWQWSGNVIQTNTITIRASG